MGRIFLILGIVLVVMWLFGFLVFNLTAAYIHFLIVVGFILIFFDIFRKHSRK